jgi:hypothetical protein
MDTEEADRRGEQLVDGDLDVGAHVAGELSYPRHEPIQRDAVEMPIEGVAGIFEGVILRSFVRVCGTCNDPQRMSGCPDASLGLVKQRLRHACRIGATGELALFSDAFREGGRVPLRLTEHFNQEFDDKFEWCAAITMKDKLNRLGIGGRALH